MHITKTSMPDRRSSGRNIHTSGSYKVYLQYFVPHIYLFDLLKQFHYKAIEPLKVEQYYKKPQEVLNNA